MRTFACNGLFVLLCSASLLGCLTKVDSTAGTAGKTCKVDKNCRDGFTCVSGKCQEGSAGDAGAKDAADGKSDGSKISSDILSSASDSKADLGSTVKLDTNAASDTRSVLEAQAPDTAAIDEDAPALAPDAPAPEPDAPASPDTRSTDASQPDTRPTDTSQPDTRPCNGGCCSNADCPVTKPVCDSTNTCVGCKVNDDCKGRSLAVCKSTGACVQCTDKSHCGALACNTDTNQCTGCVTRSDCPGACQKCGSDGSCAQVKDGDDSDLGKCAGTCDSQGQCKAKLGQKCADVAGGCISGTTCADGICCNRACSGTCEACDLSTAPGTCTVLTAGSQPRHGTCANTGTGEANTACAGSCQGKIDGTCSYAPNTTTCGTAGCPTTTSSQAAGTCNGTGLCSMPAAVSCQTGGTCSDGTCGCPASLPKECGNACVNIKTDGKNCGECGHDCLGGECVGGICQPVVVTKPAVSYSLRVFGLDSQYLYYETSAAPVNATEVYRINPDALNGSGSLLRGAGKYSPAGVIGDVLYFKAMTGMPPEACQVSDCATRTGLTNVGSTHGLASFGIPAPTDYVAYWPDGSTFTMLKLEWYDTSNKLVTDWTDTTFNTKDSSVLVSGKSVYWIRTSEDGTTVSLHTIDSTSKTLKRLATGLPTGGCGIISINAPSLLVVSYSDYSLYRVPMPQGNGTTPPPMVLSAAASFQSAVEDDNFLYWADTAGSIYKCPTGDLANCENKKVLLTTGGVTTGLVQDTKNLYWGTKATGTTYNGQLLRMAK